MTCDEKKAKDHASSEICVAIKHSIEKDGPPKHQEDVLIWNMSDTYKEAHVGYCDGEEVVIPGNVTRELSEFTHYVYLDRLLWHNK